MINLLILSQRSGDLKYFYQSEIVIRLAVCWQYPLYPHSWPLSPLPYSTHTATYCPTHILNSSYYPLLANCSFSPNASLLMTCNHRPTKPRNLLYPFSRPLRALLRSRRHRPLSYCILLNSFCWTRSLIALEPGFSPFHLVPLLAFSVGGWVALVWHIEESEHGSCSLCWLYIGGGLVSLL